MSNEGDNSTALLTAFRNWRSNSAFLSDKVVAGNILAALLLFIILLLVIFFKLKPGAEQIALHYNVLVGVDEVGSGWRVYQLPILPLIFSIYNLFLAKSFYKIEPMASHLLLFGSTIVWLLALASVLTLVNLS